MKRINHAIILAAGRGQRMAPLTNVVPKPMAPYRGTTLIANGIAKLRSVVPNIHITIGYKKTVLAPHVFENGATTVFNTEGHGNAWWIFHTLIALLDEPLFVLTCDNIVDFDAESLAIEYERLHEPACMVVPVRPVSGLAGDYIHHRNNLVTKLDRDDVTDIYCSGIQVINPSKVNALVAPTEDFYTVWKSLIAINQVCVSSVFPEKWFTVDTIEDLLQANNLGENQ